MHQSPITLKFVTSVVLYVQLLMLIYLYSAHRARFFCYIVWAWSLFVISKVSYILMGEDEVATVHTLIFKRGGCGTVRGGRATGTHRPQCRFAPTPPHGISHWHQSGRRDRRGRASLRRQRQHCGASR